MRRDNSRHIIAAAQRRRADTLERAQQALHERGKTGKRHTIAQIAAYAKVSRSWLYAQPGLRDQIRQLTTLPDTDTLASERAERGSDASLRRRLTLAHERVRELDDVNRRLRDQLMNVEGSRQPDRVSRQVTAEPDELTCYGSQPSGVGFGSGRNQNIRIRHTGRSTA